MYYSRGLIINAIVSGLSQKLMECVNSIFLQLHSSLPGEEMITLSRGNCKLPFERFLLDFVLLFNCFLELFLFNLFRSLMIRN